MQTTVQRATWQCKSLQLSSDELYSTHVALDTATADNAMCQLLVHSYHFHMSLHAVQLLSSVVLIASQWPQSPLLHPSADP